MFKEAAIEVINGSWPMIIIITMIVVTMRIAYLMKNHKKISLYKELLSLIFIIYILCLFNIVTFQDVNFGKSNYIPFKEMFRYELFTEKFFKNVMGNVILFIPYGFFTAYFLKCKRLWYPFFLTLLVSTMIEAVQLYIGRVFDIDDIILNILGGLVGYFLYRLLDKIKHKLPKIFRQDWFLNLVILIVLVLVVLWLLNIIPLGV
ncbi:MAG: VanZ family protein [bacterium]|nr:VanZ family protein [bacterium]